MRYRTGLGLDVHAFGGEGPVRLGGVAIPHERGLLGHSDADVLAHAVTDALLGAAGLGDLGEHFPDTDPAYRGADSMGLLAVALARVREAGWTVEFVDATVVGEAPRVGPHRGAVRERLAGVLGLDTDAVSVKATSTERLGALGRGEGLAALAVVTITGE